MALHSSSRLPFIGRGDAESRGNLYLKGCGLEVEMERLMSNLFSQSHLPENPYKFLVSSLPGVELNFAFSEYMQSRTAVRPLEANQLDRTITKWGICQIKLNDEVWGSGHLLRMLDSEYFIRLKQFTLEKLLSFRELVDEGGGEVLSCLPSVGGDVLLGEEVCPNVGKVLLKIDAVGYGYRFEKSLNLYAQFVLDDMLFMMDNFFVTEVAIRKSTTSDDLENEFWNEDRIRNDSVNFMRKLKRATVSRAHTYLRLILRLDITGGKPKYVKATKVYKFHYMQKQGGDDKKRRGRGEEPTRQSFALRENETFQDNLFFDRRHAEMYGGIFAGQGLDAVKFQSSLRNRQLRLLTEHYEGGHLYLASMAIMYLAIMDKKSTYIKCIRDFMFSSVGDAFNAFSSGQVILSLVELYMVDGDRRIYDALRSEWKNFYSRMQRLMQSIDRLSDVRVVKRHINFLMGEITNDKDDIVITSGTASKMQSLVYTVESIEQYIAHQILYLAKDYRNVLSTYLAEANYKEKRPMEEEQWMIASYPARIVVDVDALKCVRIPGVPPLLTKEAVMIKYSTDTGLDENLYEMFNILFSQETVPVNPYPYIMYMLKKYSVRFGLWKLSNKETYAQYTNEPREIRKELGVYQLRASRLVGVYGTKPAMLLCNAQQMIAVQKTIAPLFVKNKVKFADFSGQEYCAMTGGMQNTGVIIKFVEYIDIDHILTIQGTSSGASWQGAVEIFAEKIVDDAKALNRQREYLVEKIVLGEDDVIPATEIFTNPDGVTDELSSAISSGFSITLKGYVALPQSQTYSSFRKCYRMSFRAKGSRRCEHANISWKSLYSNIFFNEDEAVVFVESYNLPKPAHHPSSRGEYESELVEDMNYYVNAGNYGEAYQYLHRYALLKEDSKVLPETIRVLSSDINLLRYLTIVSNRLCDIATVKNRDFQSKVMREQYVNTFRQYRHSLCRYIHDYPVAFPDLKKSIIDVLKLVTYDLEGDGRIDDDETLDSLKKVNVFIDVIRVANAGYLHENCEFSKAILDRNIHDDIVKSLL